MEIRLRNHCHGVSAGTILGIREDLIMTHSAHIPVPVPTSSTLYCLDQ